jgi:hypothetical protein
MLPAALIGDNSLSIFAKTLSYSLIVKLLTDFVHLQF